MLLRGRLVNLDEMIPFGDVLKQIMSHSRLCSTEILGKYDVINKPRRLAPLAIGNAVGIE